MELNGIMYKACYCHEKAKADFYKSLCDVSVFCNYKGVWRSAFSCMELYNRCKSTQLRISVADYKKITAGICTVHDVFFRNVLLHLRLLLLLARPSTAAHRTVW